MESVGTPKRPFAVATRAPCPPPRATIAPPAAAVKRLREGEALLRSRAPSTTRPSWRYAECGQSPNAGGRQTRADARSEEGATERPVRLLRRARRRARRLRRGRRAHEPQPLEQGPQALAPRVHPHDVQGEHPAQQRRPQRSRRSIAESLKRLPVRWC